jgi:hypothetical protein
MIARAISLRRNVMKTLRLLCHSAAFAVVLMLGTSLAHAQATRTWVSGLGDDANPCSRTAPCKTFAGAITRTAPFGEIDCLDPGGYGALTITKSITIDCGDGDGGYAGSVLVGASTNGIVISAANTDIVTLRNIGFQGIHQGLNAIRFLAGAGLHVQSVQIIGFTQNGIDVSNGGFNGVTVRNSVISDVGGSGVNLVEPGFGVANLDNVQISGAIGSGVHAGTNASVTVVRSSIVGTGTGINADSAGSQANVDSTMIASNNVGLSGSGGGSVRVSYSNVNSNQTGVSGNVGSFTTPTNRFASNTMDGVFGLGAIPLK